MSESPVSASAYEVLGVDPKASTEQLRRAYRQKLRDTHPDTGGAAQSFHEVQQAWDLVGTPASRALYDRGYGGTNGTTPSYSARPTGGRQESRPPSRSSGHPGGWFREQYLSHMREWVGRGASLDDPYDAVLVRSAPRHIRHLLASAIAEEDTARALSTLGIAFTLWHDVATHAATGADAGKIDHIVLGPTGLYAVLSEDWGGAVRVKRGEIAGDGVDSTDRPVHSLSLRSKALARSARVRFSGLLIVVPDGHSDKSVIELGRVRGVQAALVQRSMLGQLLRTGLNGSAPMGGNELFDVRTRLQSTVRFV
ncbi:MAG: DnaJ domain-containing protein [Microbacteriaceae bacterium]